METNSGNTTRKTKESSNVNTYIWLIGFVTTLALFNNSKTSEENIERVVKDNVRPSPIRHGSIKTDELVGTVFGSGSGAYVVSSSLKSEPVCQSNGKCSTVYCHVMECRKALPAIEHGRLILNSSDGTMATVACYPGYQRNKQKVTCQDNRKWEKAICQPIATDLSEQEFEKTTVMKCKPGYPPNLPSITSTATGPWQNTDCYDCGKVLPAIEHGQLTLNKEQDSTYGAMATVTCDPGYQASKKKVTCQADARWEEAICQPIDVDDCSPNLCQNNGVCVDKVGDFLCQCKQWYSGKICEIVGGPCKNHKCRNGATCVSVKGGGYYCDCAPHWDGQYCERHHVI